MDGDATRILLIEDNPADYRLFRELLVDAGIGAFAISHASSLKEAVALASDEANFDVVLLDLSLPDSHGLETVHRCREAIPLLPIIVLTGQDDEALGIQAIRGGAREYLVKGQVDSRLLVRTIAYAEERHRLEAARARLTEQLREARDELERRVLERTRDLQRTVDALHGEVLARQQAEESLQASEEKFRTVFEQAPVGVATMTLDGRFTKTNRAFQEMLGYGESEMADLALDDLVYAEASDQAKRFFRDLIRDSRDTYVFEKRFSCKHGRYIWCWVNISLVRDPASQPSYAVLIMADITERRRAEKQMAELMAGEQQRLGQELHDGLVQQMIGLGMMARSLHAKLEAEHSRHADAAGELCSMIREAQNQSRAMLKGLRPVEVDADGLMAAIKDLAAGTGKWHGIRCAFQCDQPVPVEDNRIATQLFYIAREAVTNAVRHAQAKHIQIALELKGASVRLEVRDDGVGLGAGRRHEGIGLRIMRHRAGLIGATIAIGPAGGGGTLVTCTLRQEDHDAGKQDDREA